MCGYFSIGPINLMLSNKSLTDFTNLFSPNNSPYTSIFLIMYKLNKQETM